MPKGFQNWEQWAADNGVDPNAPDRPTAEEIASVHENSDPSNPLVQKRQAWREWSNRHNQWLQYAERAGVTGAQMGKNPNDPEAGQNLYKSWQAQFNADPQAQAWAKSPEAKQWIQAYGGTPWLAWQNYQQMQSDTGPHATSGSISQLPGTNLWYTGGPNGAFYNQFNQAVANPGSFQSGGLTYTPGKGWTDASGAAVAHPWQNLEAQGYSFGGPMGTAQFGGQPAGGGAGGSGAGYLPFSPGGYGAFSGSQTGGGGTFGGGTSSFAPTGVTGFGGSGRRGPSFGDNGPGDGYGGLPTDRKAPPGQGWTQPQLTNSTTGALSGGDSSGDQGAFNYQTPAFTGSSRPNFNFPGLPAFHPPKFEAPTGITMENDPGYQFRLNQGEQALQNSAAARGVLNSGGTLKGIEDYGQNFASQEYGNVFNRYLQSYGTQYQAAKDMYAPQFADYQNRFGAEQGAGMAAYNQAWNNYVFGIDDEFRREQALLNSQGPT